MHHTLLTNTLFCIAIMETLIALSLFRQRENATALPLSLIFFACAIYSAAYAGELLALSIDSMLWYSYVQYIGIVFIPPSWIFIAIRFTGETAAWSRRLLGACFCFSMLIMLLHWTDAWHQLIYARVGATPIGLNSTLDIDRGPMYWAFAAYMYFCFGLGSLLIWRAKGPKDAAYRKQRYVLLVAITFPLLGNMLFILNLTPYHDLDLSPFSTALTALYCVVTIFLLDLFNFFSIALNLLMDTLPQGVLVFNKRGSLVLVNPAARELLGEEELHAGMKLKDLGFLQAPLKEAKERINPWLVERDDGLAPRWLNISITPINAAAGNRRLGTAYVIEDVTQRQTMIHVLEEKVAQGNASLDKALNRLTEATETERNVIGREIHDTLCQELTSMVLLVDQLHNVPVEEKFGEEKNTVTHLASLVRDTQQRIRDFAHCLDQEPTTCESFVDELGAFVASINRVYRIPCELLLDEKLQLEQDAHSDHLLRIIREAVFNAVRHGGATAIWIDLLRRKNGDVVLSISNDGSPIPDQADRTEGMGFRQMRQRSRDMGATLTIHRDADNHTVVQVILSQQETRKNDAGKQ